MIAHHRLIAEIYLPGGNGKHVQSFPFPLSTPISLGRSAENSIQIPSRQAEDIEIEIENDYKARGSSIEIHSRSSAILKAEGCEVEFGRNAPRTLSIGQEPILLRFKGVETLLRLEEVKVENELLLADLDQVVNTMHQEIAQQRDLKEDIRREQVEQRSENFLRENRNEVLQLELAKGYIKRMLFLDMLGGSSRFDGSPGIQNLVTMLQTMFCSKIARQLKIKGPFLVETRFFHHAQLPIETIGFVNKSKKASLQPRQLLDLPQQRIRIEYIDKEIHFHDDVAQSSRKTDLANFVSFAYEAIAQMDLLEGLDRDLVQVYAAEELKLRVHDFFEFGPLTRFFDPKLTTVTDVSVDVEGQIYMSVQGAFFPTREKLYDYALEKTVRKIRGESGKKFDASHPFLNTDIRGVRVACTHPCVSETYQLSIRRKMKVSFQLAQLQETGAFPAWAASLLTSIIKSKKNLIISGGLGSGKTSMLIALLNEFHPYQKISSIEDTREIDLPNHHFSPLLTRHGITEQTLLESVLRSAADVIALGEIRNDRAADAMVKALNTGQIGLSTIHSNGAQDTVSRLTNLLLAGSGSQLAAVRQDISSALDFVIHVERIDGIRQIVDLCEVGDIDRKTGDIILRPILEHDRDHGLQLSGLLPTCIAELNANGFLVPDGNKLF